MCLWACQPLSLGLLLIVTYVLISRQQGMHLVALFYLSALVNLALKNTFQVPLPDHLNSSSSFAFPSGHMQMAVVMYGWSMLAARSQWITMGALTVMALEAFGLVTCGFHQIPDILGAMVTGIFLLGAYHTCMRLYGWRISLWTAMILGSACWGYANWMHPAGTAYAHMMIASLISWCLTHVLLHKYILPSIWPTRLTSMVVLVLIGLIGGGLWHWQLVSLPVDVLAYARIACGPAIALTCGIVHQWVEASVQKGRSDRRTSPYSLSS